MLEFFLLLICVLIICCLRYNKNQPNEKEDDSLAEYWVYFGTKGYTSIIAKSSAEAKEKALRTTTYKVPINEVYAIYKRRVSFKQ